MPLAVCSPDEKSASDLPGPSHPVKPFGEAGPSGPPPPSPPAQGPHNRVLVLQIHYARGPAPGSLFWGQYVFRFANGREFIAGRRKNSFGHLHSPRSCPRRPAKPFGETGSSVHQFRKQEQSFNGRSPRWAFFGIGWTFDNNIFSKS